jgi:hypothetical protein
MSAKDTLGGATKADIQKVVAIAFLSIFGMTIIGLFYFATPDVTISGDLDVNVFVGPFIGIVIGIFTWLGFKQGQQQQSSG